MGIFNFFKKKQKTRALLQEVHFNEVNNVLKNNKEIINAKEVSIFLKINSSIKELIKKLEILLESLEKVNYKKINAEEKLKLISKKGLENFIIHLNALIQDLNSLCEHENNLENLINRINQIFQNFEERSKMSYEKATIFIGDEIRKVKITISEFFKENHKIIQENNETFNKKTLLKEVEELLKKVENLNKIIKKLSQEKEKANETINEFMQQIEHNLKMINEIKNTEEYKNKINEIEKNQEKLINLKKEVFKIKESINFKALTKRYHKEHKKMSIIKDFNENFYQKFDEDNFKEFFETINETDLDKQKLEKRIKELEKEKKIIEKSNKQIDEIDELEKDISYLELEIEKQNSLVLEVQDKQEKINKTKKEKFIEIKEKIKKLGYDLLE